MNNLNVAVLYLYEHFARTQAGVYSDVKRIKNNRGKRIVLDDMSRT
jgi:hypothetical protein